MNQNDIMAAIKFFESYKMHCGNPDFIDMAVSALEKQVGRRTKYSQHNTICPNCEHFVDRYEQRHGNIEIPCCKWCGQKLDWSDTDE